MSVDVPDSKCLITLIKFFTTLLNHHFHAVMPGRSGRHSMTTVALAAGAPPGHPTAAIGGQSYKTIIVIRLVCKLVKDHERPKVLIHPYSKYLSSTLFKLRLDMSFL